MQGTYFAVGLSGESERVKGDEAVWDEAGGLREARGDSGREGERGTREKHHQMIREVPATTEHRHTYARRHTHVVDRVPGSFVRVFLLPLLHSLLLVSSRMLFIVF